MPPLGWPGPCREPLEAWRHFSRQAGALLSIAAAVHRGQPADAKDWAMFFEWNSEAQEKWLSGEWSDPDVGFHRFDLGLYLDEWLQLGNVKVGVTLGKGDLRVGYQPAGLFGNLALQLALTASRSAGWDVCMDCGMPYPVGKRNPQAGRRNFCPDCGRKAANKLAARDYRSRIGKAQQLHDQGKAIEEIAQQLVSDPDTVRGWVERKRKRTRVP